MKFSKLGNYDPNCVYRDSVRSIYVKFSELGNYDPKFCVLRFGKCKILRNVIVVLQSLYCFTLIVIPKILDQHLTYNNSNTCPIWELLKRFYLLTAILMEVRANNTTLKCALHKDDLTMQYNTLGMAFFRWYVVVIHEKSVQYRLKLHSCTTAHCRLVPKVIV